MDIEQYIDDLAHHDIFVRIQAAKALRFLQDPRAVEPLIRALGDVNPGVKRQAADALAAITGQAFGEDADSWRKWASENR